MRVFQIEGDWGIDNLCLAERPDSTPGANEVLVSMRAAALNSRDLIVPERGYGRATGELPLIPVSDGAGEVVATGEAVSRVKTGDRVCPIFKTGSTENLTRQHLHRHSVHLLMVLWRTMCVFQSRGWSKYLTT